MEKLYRLNEQLQSRLQPHAIYAAKHNITPSHFFITAMLLSLVGGLVVATANNLHWPMLFVCILLGLRLICTNIALILVRDQQAPSDLTAFLPELHLAVSEVFIYLPFAFIKGISGPLVVATVVLGLLCQMVSVIATPIISTRRRDGPITSTERLVVFAAIALFIGVGLPAYVWCNLILLALLVLEFVTFINRIRKSLDIAEE